MWVVSLLLRNGQGHQGDTGEKVLQRARPANAYAQGNLQKEKGWTPAGLGQGGQVCWHMKTKHPGLDQGRKEEPLKLYSPI